MGRANDDDDIYNDQEGGHTLSKKGRALGTTKDFQDTTGLAAAAAANAKRKPAPAPSGEPDPATMTPIMRASYEAKKKREAQAKAAEQK